MASKSSLQSEFNRVKAENPKDGFQSLLRSLRDRAAGESADFLGSRNDAAQTANSSAKVFNADGFFGDVRTSRPNGDPSRPVLDQLPVDQGLAADNTIAPKIGEPNLPPAMVERMVHRSASSNGMPAKGLTSASRTPHSHSPTFPGSNVAIIDPEAAHLTAGNALGLSISLFRDRTAPSPDRLPTMSLNLSSGFVEVTGRIDDLSRDDEERLFHLVSALLVEHGLTLANLKINGLTIASATSRK